MHLADSNSPVFSFGPSLLTNTLAGAAAGQPDDRHDQPPLSKNLAVKLLAWKKYLRIHVPLLESAYPPKQ